MSRIPLRRSPMAAVLLVLAISVSPVPRSRAEAPDALPDIGVVRAGLSAAVTNPFVALHTLRRAVYAGKERDPETGKGSRVRVEVRTRDTTSTLAGVPVTVVDVTHHSDDEVVERTREHYAQTESGDVHFIGEHVDDYEGGKLVGHDGQWVAGEQGSRAGLFMPAAPKVGDVFEQERAPGIVQNRSKVVAVGRTVKVPAGTFTDCIETEHYDPVEKVRTRKWYCRDVGLVKESNAERTVELTLRESR